MTAVWLHGAGMGTELWDPARARGLWLDLPGHGRRPRVSPPDVPTMGRVILADCPDRFDLIGHSLGGQIALWIAGTHPGRVRRLVVIDSFADPRAGTLFAAGSWMAQRVVDHLPRRALVELLSLRMRGRTRRLVRAAAATVDRGGLSDAITAATGFDARPLLTRITAPTLILVARGNPFTHAQGRAMARTIPDARFAILPGGHVLPLETPEAVYAAIDAHLESA